MGHAEAYALRDSKRYRNEIYTRQELSANHHKKSPWNVSLAGGPECDAAPAVG